MPHVEPDIDVDSPLDSDEIEQGDDEIRKLKRQLVERLQDIINSITDDPWVLANAIVKTESIADGVVTGPKIAPAAKLRSIVTAVVPISTSLASRATYVDDLTVTGAEVGDMVLFSWLNASHAFIFVHAWVPEADVVRLTIASDENATVGVVGDLQIALIKPGILFDEV
jgi:hypothetical protein